MAPARTPSRAKPPAESPLDAALKSLVQGHVAFNSPETMRVGETGEVQALLSVSIAGEQLMAELTAAGKRESDTLLVSDHMQATLAGGGAFDVSPTGPQSQWISQSETTRWHWDVTPKLTGPQVLTLTLDAILTINGDKDTRNITTLTRQIDVRVSRPHGVGEWFARIKDIIEAIGWGWGVIVAVAGVLIKFRRRLRDWFRGTGKPRDSAPEDVDRD